MQGITEKWYISCILFNGFIWLVTRFTLLLLVPFNFIVGLLPRRKCPAITDKILLYSATELAKKIRFGEIKSETVIRTYLERIEAVNPTLNAIIEDRRNIAIKEAMAVDELIKDGKYNAEELEKTQPLLGIPVTIKESIAVKGMTNNAGSLKILYEKLRATEDAPVVRYLKEAGAIVIAVTSTPELCLNWETYNKTIGTTNNPYDLRKTPGGSSGGEAALISSGASLIGIGSDIAGSLRVPAHFTGIFAHKPTPRIIPITGHYPYSPDPKFADYLVVGPLTRYAEDLQLVMNVIVKPELKADILYKELTPIKDIKVFYMMNDGGNMLTTCVSKEIRIAIQMATNYFQNTYGIQPVQMKLPLMKHSVKATNFPLLNLHNLDSVFTGEKEGPWKELLRSMCCKSKVSPITTILEIERNMFRGTKLLKNKCAESEEILNALRQEFRKLLGDNGILFYPTLTTNALYHGQFSAHAFDAAYCMIFNMLGFPATNCPIKMDSRGMPVGIQVVANPNNDSLTVSVARELEKAFGGWKEQNATERSTIISTVQEITKI